MLSDLHLSFRSLAKSRGFALIAVVTLGVGIGTSTAMFSALHALVLAPFSYERQEQLVHVWSGDGWPFSPADYLDHHEQARCFTDFGAYQRTAVNIGRENPQAVDAASTTYGVLRVFGVRPALGRFFEPADDAQGAPAVVILSHAL